MCPRDPLLVISGCGAPGATSTGDSGDSAAGDPSTVAIDQDLVLAAGATTTWEAGTVVKVTSGASITVKGTLLVQGTAAAPVQIRSAADPERAGAWGGLVVARGGTLTAKNLEIHDASRAFTAQGGAAYDVDGLVVDTSLSVLALAADGTIAHAKLHSQGDSQAALPIIVGLVQAAAQPGDAVRSDSPDVPQVFEADVDGKRVRITAQDEIVLECGSASITLRRNGRVVVRGTYIESDSDGTNRIKGGQVRIN